MAELRDLMLEKIKSGDFTDEVFQKANRELGFVENQKLEGYFLELYSSGKKYKNTPHSWLAYVLGITNEEPTEKLIVTDMGSPPDIDLDFNDRDRVLDYIVSEYGRGRVADIGTFGVFAAKGAIKYAAKALEIGKDENGEYDERITFSISEQISKSIPEIPGISIDEALEASSDLRVYKTKYPQVFEIAKILEGSKKYAGRHAAGVVISRTPLSQIVPLQVVKNNISTQYTMDELDRIGLVKFDILGLKTLSVIDDCIYWVKKRHNVDLSDIDNMDKIIYNDKKTMLLFKLAKTDGVFQLESGGMKDALAQLNPDTFDDINAIVAAFRPGPKKYLCKKFYEKYKDDTDSAWRPGITYAENKQSDMKHVSYLVPEFEHILKETYGVIIYQEQVIMIAQEVAGFSPVEADLLRYAMGKKVSSKMASLKPKFIQGVINNGYSKEIGIQIWDRINKFSAYAFNKSHSAGYAKLAFQTAYLKANYPTEFFAALLTSCIGDEDKLKRYMHDASDFKIKFSEIDINKSKDIFIPEDKRVIRVPLNAVKGVGKHASEIVNKQPFNDLYDFCSRVNPQFINKTAVEALARVGAFKKFGYRPEDLVEEYLKVKDALRKRDRKAKPSGDKYEVEDLFDLMKSQ
jgi:DNA polymerase III subunit alpha